MAGGTPARTIADLRAEMARKEAELAKKRAARLQAAMEVSARIAESYTRQRVTMERDLADAIAKVATTAAMCEIRTNAAAEKR